MTKWFPKGYDRRIWILFYSRLIDGVGFSIIGPFLALFMYQSLGVSMAMVGLVLLMAGLAGAGGSLVGGLMADRYGRWGVMTWSMLLRCITFLVLAFQVSLWPDVLGVSITLTLSYFFGGVFDPANNAMVADLVEPAKRLEAYGLMRVAWNLGFAIGPMIGGILVAWSFLWTFVISAVISLLAALVVAFFLSETYVPKPREKGPGLLKSIGSVNKLFLVFCIVLMPMFIMSGQFGVIYVVFANERVGIDTVTIGAIFALNGLMVVLLQFPIARWLEGTKLLSGHGRRIAALRGRLPGHSPHLQRSGPGPHHGHHHLRGDGGGPGRHQPHGGDVPGGPTGQVPGHLRPVRLGGLVRLLAGGRHHV